MKTLILLFLTVAVVLVAQTDAAWIRAWRFSRWIPVYRHTVGKRSADDVDAPLSQDDDDAMQANEAMDLLNKLSLRCPGFGTDTKVGLNKALVTDAFDAVDKNKNNQLCEKELDELQDVLDAFEDCEQTNAHKTG
ncbi:uncharacterized protein LOC143300976 isoform X2 [Babylonia areolata]|uniref:uncharacterized protein LOC143300976 isoform X2 n=1 Tax=Babylonia areolata TaxID=304850 RepID=UPI003FD0C58C